MAILGWFFKKRKSDKEDYETVLSELSSSIATRQQRLADIRLRQRRTTLLVTLYFLAAWLVYTILWYFGKLPLFGGMNKKGELLRGIPLFIGPILTQFTRRIVQVWYGRIGSAEEKTLKELLTKQRHTVEAMKKETKYDETRRLIEKYDSPSGPTGSRTGKPPTAANGIPGAGGIPSMPQAQLRQRVGKGAKNGLQQVPQTPVRGRDQFSTATGQTQSPIVTGGYPMSPPQFGQPLAYPPYTPPRKQWYDKLADALLGDDESSASPSNRYALICQKCFAHNGLVREDGWEDAQYVCPKCGHFNPSRRSMKATATSVTSQRSNSPPSPKTPSPQRTSPNAPSSSPTRHEGELTFEHVSSPPSPETQCSRGAADDGDFSEHAAEKSSTRMEIDS